LLQRLVPRRTKASVSPKQKLASPVPEGTWTKPDAYLGALARKRSFRLRRRAAERTQPETPRLLLSTLPFLALLGLLAVLAVAIMVVAFPGNQPQPRPEAVAQHEQGVAGRGWFQEAQKEFHNR
jgi:hypothetical protein